MLPLNALRLGNFGRAVFTKSNAASALCIRASSTKPVVQENPIQKAYDYFNSPDRDYENFPHPKQAMFSPKVRMGFIPEAWFQAFYDKTGVTGPYLFGTGLIATLLSKEIWVVDHGFTEVLCFTAALTIVVKKLGPTVAEYADKLNEKREDVLFHAPIREARAQDEQFIVEAEDMIGKQEGQKFLYEAKRENIDLQLEAEYRQRISEAYQAVKNRLDHQLDTKNANIRFQQQHMVRWIVDNVVKSITPQQEQDSIKKCLADLKGMATAHA